MIPNRDFKITFFNVKLLENDTTRCSYTYNSRLTDTDDTRVRDGPALIDARSQILVENRDFCPCQGSPSEYNCDNAWYEKLEWCRYPTVKKIEDTSIRFDRIHKRDRRTDGHGTTVQAALMHSIAR